jgi:DNA helicase HerA-like ATPase
MTKAIGTISATEKDANTCDEFMFWLDNKVKISPFDIVTVENPSDKSKTYGIVQDIFHITDSPGHISNYVSSDFGLVGAEPLTKKLALTYAKAKVIDNSAENYMPVIDGSLVFPADEDDINKALGLEIRPEKAFPAGLLKTSNGVSVPILYNSDFVIGPEGAHVNISGISGLATKTSYAMFLMKAMQELIEDVAIIILNVKGDDLLRLEKPNTKITDKQKEEWDKFKIKCEPFKDVKYYYPYKKTANNGKFANTALASEDLDEQFSTGKAQNYIYVYEHDRVKIDLLLSNIDDPNYTIESILNFMSNSNEFEQAEMSWEDFRAKVREYANQRGEHRSNKEIASQSWYRFSRLIGNSIKNDIFQNSISGDKQKNQTYLSKEITNIEGGVVYVVDIAKLDEQTQCLVFGDIIRTVYNLKHGEYEDERKSTKEIPKKVVIFVDELNKYAPSTSPKNSPILNYLLEITERGRSEGVILFSAEQFKSAVHDRVKGNCSTHVYGRTNAIEISKPDYRYIPKVYSGMMNRLDKGDLIIQHPIFKTLLKIAFPYPAYQQGENND